MLATLHAWASALWPLWLTILFVGIVAWVYWPKRKARLEAQGQIPLRNDDDQGR